MSTTDDRARVITAEGTSNLRDLGGYRARGGRHTRWRTLFRSDDLARLTPRGIEDVRGLHLRLVCDLRDADAAGRRPHLAVAALGIGVAAIPIGGSAAIADVTALLARSNDPDHWVDFATELYRSMAEKSGPAFASLARAVSDPSALPAAFHCTGGKDRTGLAAAILLACVGVDRQDILDDHELTTSCSSAQIVDRLRPTWEAAGISVEAVLPVVTAPRFALDAALDWIEVRFGDVERYLVTNGAPPDIVRRLERVLLTP